MGIKWCLKTRNGIELVNPNNNMSESYMKMAEESLKIIKRVEDESMLWASSSAYYTIYYCLYSLMIKLGIKCEIHKCSIEFMKMFLIDIYNKEDVDLIETAFSLRNDLQYYPDKLVSKDKLEFVKEGAIDFLVKTKEVLSRINEKEISQIRNLLEKEIEK